MESGLGNQMLSYCEYLAMKKCNPNDDIYIETIIFDMPECNEVICQWNGYELNRIFGIDVPNVREYFTEAQWTQIMRDIRDSEFWLRNWNYPVHFTNAFRNAGLDIKNIRGDFEKGRRIRVAIDRYRKKEFKDYFRDYDIYIYLKLKKDHIVEPHRAKRLDNRHEMFVHSDENLFSGQKLLMRYVGSGIEDIEQEIRNAFVFPALTDELNMSCMDYIRQCNSVAIHARRGDMLCMNYPCYRFGYFKRAVGYIRKHVSYPVFFIFCDPGSVQWAKDNAKILGLDFKKDEIHFVDWNKGMDSFRDMQLMAACKHQVITDSSFGWWGAWLNTNPDKITCSPSYMINTTHTF